jgi:hypothetical protein
MTSSDVYLILNDRTSLRMSHMLIFSSGRKYEIVYKEQVYKR